MVYSVRRFAADRGGNFAILSAFLAVPVVLAAGVAIDLSTIQSKRVQLQQAMDAAVLAVARDGRETSEVEAHRIALNFVTNNFDLAFTGLDVQRDGMAVTVKASARADMAFGGLLGYGDWPVMAASTADIAYASYEIALALDTTGSMAGGKLGALKDAVDGLIESMSVQMQDKNRLRFALVPFATFVNVGPQYGPSFDSDGIQIAGTGAPWLDLRGESPIGQTELQPGASRFQAYHNVGKSWPGCVETRPGGDGDYDVSPAAADRKKPVTLFVPAFAIDEPDTGGYVNSYIASPVEPGDKSPSGKKAKLEKYALKGDDEGKPLPPGLLKKVLKLMLGGGGTMKGIVKIDDKASGYEGFAKGPGFGCSTKPIVPLSNDYLTMRQKVKDLTAQGTTNIMEGVAWAHRVLTSGGPFPGAQKAGAGGVQKIMIVVTDGANTLDPTKTKLGSQYSSYGFLSDGRLLPEGAGGSIGYAMNKRTLAACTLAKQAGVTVYTIRLEEPDQKTGEMLEECATSPAHYFDAPSRAQLGEVFQSIKDRIARVRLSS